MNYTSVFSDRAEKELMESWRWYEERVHGLGDRFSEAVIKTIIQIENNPTKGLARHSVLREAIVKTFPYLIIYRVYNEGQIIYIHSIFHIKRSPKRKYKA